MWIYYHNLLASCSKSMTVNNFDTGTIPLEFGNISAAETLWMSKLKTQHFISLTIFLYPYIRFSHLSLKIRSKLYTNRKFRVIRDNPFWDRETRFANDLVLWWESLKKIARNRSLDTNDEILIFRSKWIDWHDTIGPL